MLDCFGVCGPFTDERQPFTPVSYLFRVELKVLEHTPAFLDESDGLFKDFYLVNVVQDFPHKSGLSFNFTRKASTDQMTVESQGEIMGFIQCELDLLLDLSEYITGSSGLSFLSP